MKRFILPIFFAVISFSTVTFSQTRPIKSDFQIWNDTSVTFPLKKSKDKKGKDFDRMTVSINGTLRFGRNASRPVDERIGFGFNYRLNKYISFVPDYLYRGYQPFQGRKDFESRFRFAVVLENKWKYFSLNDRNQIEYRLRNSRQDSVRYRNRFRLNVPVTKDKKELFTPFVSDEPYYDFQAHHWTRNEFFAGIGKRFNKNFAADIFYLLVNDKSFPKTVNGIGVNLRFKID
ncbi:MAG: DUF2490 domain-containing protein [Pyrinomonadaceae bacterium]